ncbi:MAG: PAS domain S-box protein, partial [Bacteroidetes bacterium]|nr:PAS domain S-box protein [Bacteroidota bacterium]
HYLEFMLSGRSSDYYETPVITKYGTQSWFGQNTNRVVDQDGSVYFSVFARDIDQRKTVEEALGQAKLEIEKSERKYRSIIENMQLGLLEVDLNNTIIKVYPHFNEMTGYVGEELLGKNAPQIFGVEGYEKVHQRQEEIVKSGATGVYELQLRKKNGDFIWVMISGAPFYDENGKVAGSIGIHYNITDRKLLEVELIQAKKKAEAAQEAEKLFLASMSHEIRTPLNAIIGMSHLMNETSLDKTQKDYLQILQSSANILQHLISDILDISKIDSSSFELNINSLNLHELCTSLLRSFDYKKQNKQIDFILDFDESIKHQIFSDAQALSQVLINLISNAEKFTAEGKVTLSIKNEHQHNDGKAKICISVQDTGVGISEEKQAHIFDRFKQADKSISSEYGGTGLGLYISRQLVNLLGGELRVVSKEGQGACFYFCFEVELDLSSGELSVQNPSPVNKGLAILQGMRVLVAEDNTMNQRYISTLLNKVGIIFDIGNDGHEAVELYTNRSMTLF